MAARKQWIATLNGSMTYRTKDREFVRDRAVVIVDAKEAEYLKSLADFNVVEDDAAAKADPPAPEPEPEVDEAPEPEPEPEDLPAAPAAKKAFPKKVK